MTTKHQHVEEVHLIDLWLHATTEPFDDWDWDGHELTLFLNKEPIEKFIMPNTALRKSTGANRT